MYRLLSDCSDRASRSMIFGTHPQRSLLANGERPKIVHERLGHSDISMTLNRYSHATMDMQRKAAND